MATIEEYIKFIADFSEINEASDAYRELGETSVETMAKAQEAIDRAQEANTDYNETVKRTVKQQEAAQRATKSLNQEQQRGRRTLLDRVRGFKVLGSTVGDLVDTYKNARKEGASFGQAFSRVGKQVGGSTRFFSIARAGLAGLAVGAAAAIGSLIASSQQFKDSFDDVRAQVSAGANVFRDRLVQVGGAITNIFNQSLGETISQIGSAFKGVGDELQREVTLARALEQATRRLRRETILLNAERAAADNRIRQLKFVIDDVTASYAQRVEANRQALDIERDLVGREQEAARQQLALALGDVSGDRGLAQVARAIGERFGNGLDLTVSELEARTDRIIEEIGSGAITFQELQRELTVGQGEAGEKEVTALADAFINLQQVQQRSIELQTEYNNSLNSINKEEQDRVNAVLQRRLELQRDLRDAQQAITDALRDSANLEGIDLIEQQRTIALEQIQALEDTAKAAFAAAGVRFDQEDNFLELRRRANQEADDAKKEYNFQTQRELIEQTRARQEAEIALIQESGDEQLSLEEFQAQERLRVQEESLQQLRQVAVQEFGATSQEVLAIDVQIAEAQRGIVDNTLSSQARIRQDALNNAELRKQIALADVELVQELADKSIDIDKFKNRERLRVELEFLQEKQRLLQEDPAASGLELELIGRQIQGIEQEIANLGSINLGPLQRIKQGLLDALNIDEATLNNLAGQVGQIFNNLASGITSNVDRQISEYDRLIARLDQQIADTETALEEQRQLQADGFANDVATFEAKLADEQALREEAAEKQIELQKAQARQQLIVDAATQASALGVAAAQLIAAEASKGLVGLVLVAGGLATLFSLFSRYKAEAAQLAAQEPQFRTGGRLEDGLISGPSHENGGIRVRDRQKRTYEIEGGEFMVNREQTDRYYGALDAINSGSIDRMSDGQALALMGRRAVNDIGQKVQRGEYQLRSPGIDYEELRAMHKESAEQIVYAIYDQIKIAAADGKFITVKQSKFKTSKRIEDM